MSTDGKAPELRGASGDSADGTSLSLWQVRAFLMVAECRSITEASRRLFLTQSGMSRVIHELESALGVRVFERCPDGMRLTDAGAAFEPYARRLDECYSDAISGAGTPSGSRITLAGSNVVLPAVLPMLLDRLMGEQQSPLAGSLAVHELASHEVLEHVITGKADMGLYLGPGGLAHPDMVCTPLLRAPLGLLAGPGMVLPAAVPNLAALAHLPLARLADEMALPQALRAQGVVFGAYFSSRVVSNSMPALFSTVAQGRLVTLVSAISANHAAARHQQFLPLPHLLPPLWLYQVSRANGGPQAHRLAWLNAVCDCVRRTPWPACVEQI